MGRGAAIARRLGIPMAHQAFKWVLRDSRVTSALIGARTVAQLEDSPASLKGPGAGELPEIETIPG